MSSTKEMIVFIQDWIYHINRSDKLTVFTGKEAQYDAKQKLYRESEMEYKLVAEDVPSLTDACRGDLYRVRVKEELDTRYGYQRRISSAERVESALIHTIQSFLSQIRERCLTPKRRDALIDAYGAKTFDAILANPSSLDIIKAEPNIKHRIYRAITEKRDFSVLLAFLSKRKWDCRWAIPLYEKYGDETILQLRRDPYLLYQHDLASFKAADWVFLNDGGTVHNPLRCRRAVLAALLREAKQNGGTFIPRKELRKEIASLLWNPNPNAKASNCTISEADISKALDWLEECGVVHTDRVGGREDVYISSLYHAEVSVAAGVKILCQTKKPVTCPPYVLDSFLLEYRNSKGQQLTADQRIAVKQMLTAPVSVITGGPGTGKTFLVEAAIAALHELCPQAVVQCCAPTGKAANRMPAEASTIARLSRSGKWKRVNRSGSRTPDIVFVDEVSMVDIGLFVELLDVVPAGARLVLIGDQDQLPSIEPGQVLRDLIDSGVIRIIHLREVFRQEDGSAIRSNAAKIIQAAVDEDIHLDEKGAGFAFNVHLSNPHRIPNAVIKAIEIVQKSGIPLREIPVITWHQRGELGTRNWNHLLQDHFNPQNEENKLYCGGKEFRLHDRVIHIKNNYDLNVFNGETGEITEIHRTREWALTVQYDSKAVHYSEKDLEELDLAYALTAHKSQGSEYSVVIIPIAGKGITRRLLYTAVTRGKKLVLLVGTEEALTAEMRGETTDKRASHLTLRLQKILPPVLPETEQLSMFPPVKN